MSDKLLDSDRGESGAGESPDSILIDADGVIDQTSPSRKKALRQPVMMAHAMAGAVASLQRVIDALVDVDTSIETYADLLARAQPLNSGRVVIIFTKSHRVMIDKKCFYDIVPVPMRMVLFVGGTWHLRRPLAYKKLEEIRVGHGLPSDRLVVQVLRELDKLFAARARLTAYLTNFRVPVVPATRSAVAQAHASLDRFAGLQSRLRLDWKEDALGCRQAIRNDRKRKSVAKKKKPPNP